jgi:hypothetical protein
LQDYYHQVLLQVYRLLFVFVAEDRDLLIPGDVPDIVKQTFHKYYSTYRIRDLARKKRGTRHCDLWQQLILLFNGLYDGNRALGLPALGSFLFKVRGSEIASLRDTTSLSGHLTTSPSSTPDLDFCSIANSDLLSAIRYLCYTQKNNIFQPINYRNLGPEELGSVYESLLEMHPEINLEAAYFKLNVVSGSERKTTGSYYTPSSLVNCLLDSALEPVIEAALKGRDTTSPSGHLTTSPSGHLTTSPSGHLTTSPEKALLALKICDPACGSGHFLIAAAHRLAKRLASIRAGEEEPAPSVVQHALRDVIGHCIYGVDLNLMAVELCKISLWMEALEPGKPLTFLDHHIQCGNSLLGCTPALLKKGIPDAAFTPLTGDDKDYCNKYKKLNKEERDKDILDIFSGDEKPWEHLGNHAPYLINLNLMDDTNIENLKRKEEAYAEIMRSSGYLNSKFIYDAWCAAFVWKKAPSDTLPYPITQRLLDNIDSNPYSVNPAIRSEIMRLTDEYKFFHWHIAFPDVFPLTTSPSGHLPTSPTSGFDCILGNPPWERVKLQEKEFFSAVDAEIANAPNAAARKRLIDALPISNPLLYQAFLAEKRISEGSSLLIREGGKYPLCGRGDVNTYTVFAELNRILLSAHGRCGCIVPSGIATDDSTKEFFQDLMKFGSLASFYEFENDGFFSGAGQGHMLRFALVTMTGKGYKQVKTDFVFQAHEISDLQDVSRHFSLDMNEISLINPNTRTCPIFRSKQDAELTKYIYRRVPVLINENDPVNGNPWGISFKRMFDMSNDSHLFKTKQQLEEKGFELQGNHFVKDSESYLPLYESKMIYLYDHRFGDFSAAQNGKRAHVLPEQVIDNYRNPQYTIMPYYWVPDSSVKDALHNYQSSWMLGFRNVTDSRASARSVITALFPISGVGNSLPIIIAGSSHSRWAHLLLANLSSLVLDFCSRFKIGGLNLNFFIIKQLPILPPSVFQANVSPLTTSLSHHLTTSLIELIYTSYSLQPFAQDCGYDGPPFIWDEERRFEIRCELDALFFHLYLGSQADWEGKRDSEMVLNKRDSEIASLRDSSTSPSGHLSTSPSGHLSTSLSGHLSTSLIQYLPTPRHAVEYIMETFPIVKRKDEKEYGEYRTKLRILEIYDQMTHCLATNTEYRSTLNPPPGPPCDAEGNFIPVDKWDKNNWPKHIHTINKE